MITFLISITAAAGLVAAGIFVGSHIFAEIADGRLVPF